jgi:hypothetical protein
MARALLLSPSSVGLCVLSYYGVSPYMAFSWPWAKASAGGISILPPMISILIFAVAMEPVTDLGYCREIVVTIAAVCGSGVGPSNVACWQILLKKGFADELKFLGPLMRFSRGNVRDHIVSPKIDHGPA